MLLCSIEWSSRSFLASKYPWFLSYQIVLYVLGDRIRSMLSWMGSSCYESDLRFIIIVKRHLLRLAASTSTNHQHRFEGLWVVKDIMPCMPTSHSSQMIKMLYLCTPHHWFHLRFLIFTVDLDKIDWPHCIGYVWCNQKYLWDWQLE